MTGHDLSRLSPADAAVTLRSLDRRFRTAARPVDDPEVEAWADVPGPDGHSARAHVAAATRALDLLRDALHRVDTHDDPELDRAVMDPAARHWAPHPSGLGDALDALGTAGAALADDIEAMSSDSWSRRGRTPDGGETDALEIVREAVRSALRHLDATAAAMRAARDA